MHAKNARRFSGRTLSRLFNVVGTNAGYSEFDESDEFCPYCDNHFVLEAETPEMPINSGMMPELRIDARYNS